MSDAGGRLTYPSELVPPGDRLVHADLAEQALEGLVRAPRYAYPHSAHAVMAYVDVQSEDGQHAGQLVFGEAFDVLFRRAGRAYGRARRDGMVGWVADNAIAAGAPLARYRVSSRHVNLPFNALVQGDEGVAPEHLAAIGTFDEDIAAVAEGFIDVPVQAGKRASDAVDAISLVQQALFACGHAAPRRADELARTGHAVAPRDPARGDVVVWVSSVDPTRGHAGIMTDDRMLIHACSTTGVVTCEALADLAAGLSGENFEAPVIRRFGI